MYVGIGPLKHFVILIVMLVATCYRYNTCVIKDILMFDVYSIVVIIYI